MTWLHLVLAVAVIFAVRPRWLWFPYDFAVVWLEHRRACVQCSPAFEDRW